MNSDDVMPARVHPVESICNGETEIAMGASVGSMARSTEGSRGPQVNKGGKKKRLSNAQVVDEFRKYKMEEIYRTYVTRLYRTLAICLMAILLLYGVTLIILFNIFGESIQDRVQMNVVLSCAIVIAFVGLVFVCIRRFYERWHLVITLLVCLFMMGIVYLFTGLFPEAHHSSLDDVPMVIYAILVIHTMLPLKKRYSILFGIATAVVGVIVTAVVGDIGTHTKMKLREVGADAIMYICVNLVGLYHKFVTDYVHRMTFLETRNYIEAQVRYGQQKERQSEMKEMLLRKVMPENLVSKIQDHLREEVINDGDQDGVILDTEPIQFHALFIDLSRNVSILYADIVKFTPLTASLTPSELVHALNQLFGRFDQLAKDNDCYRIKILGDCYYCVSGLPDATENHAKNCVRMGIQMIKIIRQLRYETGINTLDMRIGIHTGTVLHGILGRQKLQYDIWSDAVSIANHMESSGEPGKVHITQATKECLDDEFEVAEGSGRQNDSLLDRHNIDTFLITPTKADLLGVMEKDETDHQEPDGGQRQSVVMDAITARRRMSIRESVDKFGANNRVFDSLAEYVLQRTIPGHLEVNERLREVFGAGSTDTISPEMKNIKDVTPREINRVFLVFRRSVNEWNYLKQRDISLKAALGMAMIIFLGIFAVQALVIKRTVAVYVTFGCGFFVSILSGGMIFIFDYKVIHYKSFVPPWVSHPATTACFRFIAIFLVIGTLFALSIVAVDDCAFTNIKEVNLTLYNDSWLEIYEKDGVCIYPAHFLYCLMLSMIACVIFVRLIFPLKVILLLAEISIFFGIFFGKYGFVFGIYDVFVGDDELLQMKIRGPLYISVLFLTLVILSRQIELDLRKDFLWKAKIAEEKRQVERSEKLNTKLLENILPRHVAEYFLTPERNLEEVYHGHYNHVTVMFAAIPNFFYEENLMNQEGKECIRALNEILIAFDKLLRKEEYNTIEKIKSINTTYMAAAGLALEDEGTLSGDDTTVTDIDIKHVKQMTHFALEIMDIMEDLNRHFFSQYTMRIGINHGKAIAGVVGAQKPQYDIWGDTVNVASRMESHGEEGKIQVPERTKEILSHIGIQCEQKREISIKGKGLMSVYFVRSPTGNPDELCEVSTKL